MSQKISIWLFTSTSKSCQLFIFSKRSFYGLPGRWKGGRRKKNTHLLLFSTCKKIMEVLPTLNEAVFRGFSVKPAMVPPSGRNASWRHPHPTMPPDTHQISVLGYLWKWCLFCMIFCCFPKPPRTKLTILRMRITNKVNYFQFHQPTSGSFGKGMPQWWGCCTKKLQFDADPQFLRPEVIRDSKNGSPST